MKYGTGDVSLRPFFMRLFSYMMRCLVALPLLVACNDEVFVVELTPSQSVLDFSEEGGTAHISFNTGDWSIPALYMDGTGSRSYFLLVDGVEHSIWPPSLEGEGTLVIKDGARIVAELSRSGPRSLDVTMWENFSSARRTLEISVSDDLFSKTITVSQADCKWTLESVRWDEASAVSEVLTALEAYPLTVDNKGNEDVTLRVNVFERCFNSVQFSELPGTGSMAPDFPDPDASVIVPEDVDTDGKLVFAGREVSYGGTLQKFRDGLPQVEKSVVFKPGRHTYKLLIEYKQLTVNYTAVYKTGSGKYRAERKGTFARKSPTGWWYGVWSE